MKLNKYIYIVMLILIISISWYFIINSYNKKVVLEKKNEIEKKLNSLEVSPSLKFSSWTTNTWNIDWNIPKRTTSWFIKDERIEIMTFSNIKQCDSLKFLKLECTDNFLFELAIKENSLSTCNEIYDNIKKLSCIDEINSNNLDCLSIKNTALKNKCNYTLAEKKKLETNDQLFIKALKENDADLCKKLSSYSKKEECIKEIIIEKKDMSLCKYIFPDIEEQKTCYSNVSYDFNRYIISEVFKTKNLSLCSKITSEELIKQCKSMQF